MKDKSIMMHNAIRATHRLRQRILSKRGLRVLRIKNEEVEPNIEEVLTPIAIACTQTTSPPLSSPTPLSLQERGWGRDQMD